MQPSSKRRVVGGAAALMLIGATVLSTTGAAVAAVPTATPVIGPLPATYAAGYLAGFRTTLTNGDTSTISQVFVTVTPVGAASGGTFFAVGKINGTIVAGACTQTAPFQCSFRNLKPQYVATVEVAFTPDPALASVSASAVWTSNGSTSSDGGTSHGDTWNAGSATANLSNDPNYAGGYQTSADGAVANLQIVSKSNLQATKLAKLPAGVAATVLDGPGGPDVPCVPNPSLNITCTGFIGEWSVISVGDGLTYPSAFQVIITFFTGAPKAFVHTYVDTSVTPNVQAEELILACTNKNNPAAGAPCFTWSNKDKAATIYTFHNGSVRGL